MGINFVTVPFGRTYKNPALLPGFILNGIKSAYFFAAAGAAAFAAGAADLAAGAAASSCFN